MLLSVVVHYFASGQKNLEASFIKRLKWIKRTMRAKLDQIGQNYCNSTSVSLFVVCFAFAGCRSRFCLWLNEILKPAAYSARLCSSLALTSQAGRQAYRQEEDGDQITNCGDSCQSSINLNLIKSVNKTSSCL